MGVVDEDGGEADEGGVSFVGDDVDGDVGDGVFLFG